MPSLSLLNSIPKIISQSELASYLYLWIGYSFPISSWSLRGKKGKLYDWT